MKTVQSDELLETLEKGLRMGKKELFGIAMAIIINAVGMVWWTSRLSFTVEQHTILLDKHEIKIGALADKTDGLNEKLARFDENQKFQTQMLQDIKATLAGMQGKHGP